MTPAVRSDDLERNEIEMIDYSEFDERPAAAAFAEIARRIGAGTCPEHARACAVYSLNGEETNETTVDIVIRADNAAKALQGTLPEAGNYPGGDTVWDQTDVQFNACPGNTKLYGAFVHELGHAFGLHAGRRDEADFSGTRHQLQLHPSMFLLQSAMALGNDAKCSPHPLDVMGIYALYQNAVTPQ